MNTVITGAGTFESPLRILNLVIQDVDSDINNLVKKAIEMSKTLHMPVTFQILVTEEESKKIHRIFTLNTDPRIPVIYAYLFPWAGAIRSLQVGDAREDSEQGMKILRIK